MLAIDLHRALELPALPHAPAGVVGRAEHRHVDVVLLQLGGHVLIVHAPDALLVLDQRRQHNLVSVLFYAMRKANVGWAVEKNGITRRGKGGERGYNAAQHAVLVANVVSRQAAHAVSARLPVNNGLIVLIARREVAKRRVLDALCHGARDGRSRGEIHVGDPHGDGVEALRRRVRGHAARAKRIDRNGVHAVSFHD